MAIAKILTHEIVQKLKERKKIKHALSDRLIGNTETLQVCYHVQSNALVLSKKKKP